MVAAVCVIMPHTGQPHFARGSVDVMGTVCVALGELHTWAALPFPASKAFSVSGVSSNPIWCMCHTTWHGPVPHPFGNKPQNPPQPHGDTDSLPSAVQAALQGNRSQWMHRGELSWRTEHGQTHTCSLTASLHFLLGTAKEALSPAKGPPEGLSHHR